MKEKYKNIILYSILILLSLTLFLMIIHTLLMKSYFAFFWYCYIAIFLIIIGLFKKNSSLILSQVIIIAIPDLLWIFDFIYLIFTGHVLLGVAQNFIGGLFDKIISLQHLYVVPLSLLALSTIKTKKNYKILLISLGEIILIFLLTLFFVPGSNIPSSNVNCVHESCTIFPMNFLPYYVEWFLFTFGFVIISYLIIISLPFIKKR